MHQNHGQFQKAGKSICTIGIIIIISVFLLFLFGSGDKLETVPLRKTLSIEMFAKEQHWIDVSNEKESDS